MKKEYLKRDEIKKTEQTWCKISENKIEHLDWIFVEQQALQFDAIGDAGVRDNIMTMCKLLVLVRQQTIDKTIEMLTRFKDSNNDASAVIMYDPLAKKPSPATFVFFHVGDNVDLPIKLVDSIKKTNPKSRIVMCTDAATPKIESVERREFEVDTERLMYSRWKAYSKLDFDTAALYLDTDMIVRGIVDVDALLDGKDYVFCSRSFDKFVGFNGKQRGLDFSEYHNRPIGTLYPILGCFVATRSSAQWKTLFEAYAKLDDKFKRWYGDQEILRDFSTSLKIDEFNLVEESQYACLPEHVGQSSPHIVHYKGNRKNAAA